MVKKNGRHTYRVASQETAVQARLNVFCPCTIKRIRENNKMAFKHIKVRHIENVYTSRVSA